MVTKKEQGRLMRGKTSEVMGIALSVLALYLFPVTAVLSQPLQSHAQDLKESGQKSAHAEFRRFAGKWVRPDGGHILEIKDIKQDGNFKAACFSPKPINVSKAEWRHVEGRIQVLIELQDVTSPGSTYTLFYSREQDNLSGYYYDTGLGKAFDVVFVRAQQ